MLPHHLSAPAVRRAALSIHGELGASDRGRIDQLIALIKNDGTIPLAEALKSLYPQHEHTAALTAFRQLRARIQSAAEQVGATLVLETDGATRTLPEQRICWFTGDDGAVEAVTLLDKREIQGHQRGLQDGIEVRDGKPVIRYFVSYAHADENLAFDLLKRLDERLALAPNVVFERWDDRNLEPGQRWREEIAKAVERCSVGLLLTSTAFLTSSFITAQELPRFVPRTLDENVFGKRAIPVALKRLFFDGRMDLKGLEEIQVFHGKKRRDYSRCNTVQRDDFADDLFVQIMKAVEISPPPSFTPPRSGHDLDASLRRAMNDRVPDHRVANDGYCGTVDKLDAAPSAPLTNSGGEKGERRDALTFLMEWAHNPKERPYFALLGDLGMGKTTTCRAFTEALLQARDEVDTDKPPLPIYFDLRHLGEIVGSDLSLEAILNRLLKGMWRGGQTDPGLTVTEVIRLVRQEGALILFDGLDEVLVHLSPAAGQRFTRELFRILPPDQLNEPGAGRLLLSCRTHYFRTLRDQQTHLTAEGRDGIKADLYRSFILLPFSKVQILDYLAKALPEQDPQRVLDLIHSVHNLTEMAERPYTLSLLAQHIAVIEQWRAEGRSVTGVDLYRHMVLSWLERDTGKHQLIPDHKQLLMEHFAAALWRSGRKSWKVDEIEQALINLLIARPDIDAHYQGKDRELLKEDLRTATFLAREGDTEFRFAHSSLQEFFLASHLHRALLDNRPEDWDMPRPSRETLDFLGQMMNGEGADRALVTLRAIRDGVGIGQDRSRIAELAFDYTLVALAAGYQAPPLAGFQLDGADLRGWKIEAEGDAPHLNLTNASFRGARLNAAVFKRVTLDGANFSDAILDRAEFQDGRAVAAKFTGSSLIGTLFRLMKLDSTEFTNARIHRTKWLRCQMANVQLPATEPPAAMYAACEPLCQGYLGSGEVALKVLGGHKGIISCCAFSPDAAQLVSADQGNLRVWDACSGDVLLVLHSPQRWITACTFAPDGSRIVSAGTDGTLRVWEAGSGDELTVLRGHEGAVNDCAYSPDGSRIVSAGTDGTVRVWEAGSGDELTAIRGHKGGVIDCAYSPDGSRIVSAGGDGAVRVWDAASGDEISVFDGHKGKLISCAYSPDGSRIVSIGEDETVRIWDAESGEKLASLHKYHGAPQHCVYTREGARIVSVTVDGTMRVWDPTSGDVLFLMRDEPLRRGPYALSPDSTRIVSVVLNATLRVWDVVRGDALAILDRSHGGVSSLAFSPDGGRVVSSCNDGTVRIWDAASGEAFRIVRDDWVSCCAFTPSGKLMLSIYFGSKLRVWDTNSGETIGELSHRGTWVVSCAISNDGARIAWAHWDGTIEAWDFASGEALPVIHGADESFNPCAFSPDGAQIVSLHGDGTELCVWDVISGDVLVKLGGHQRIITSVAYSPDGSQIVSASTDGSLRVWDVVSGKIINVLDSHQGSVTCCAYSPDGKWIVSGFGDGALQVWDISTSSILAVLSGSGEAIGCCVFAPDGDRIVITGPDGSIRLWSVSSERALWTAHLFKEGGWATFGQERDRLVEAAGDAWRYLAWVEQTPLGPVHYPAEVFGPLPEPKRLSNLSPS